MQTIFVCWVFSLLSYTIHHFYLPIFFFPLASEESWICGFLFCYFYFHFPLELFIFADNLKKVVCSHNASSEEVIRLLSWVRLQWEAHADGQESFAISSSSCALKSRSNMENSTLLQKLRTGHYLNIWDHSIDYHKFMPVPLCLGIIPSSFWATGMGIIDSKSEKYTCNGLLPWWISWPLIFGLSVSMYFSPWCLHWMQIW